MFRPESKWKHPDISCSLWLTFHIFRRQKYYIDLGHVQTVLILGKQKCYKYVVCSYDFTKPNKCCVHNCDYLVQFETHHLLPIYFMLLSPQELVLTALLSSLYSQSWPCLHQPHSDRNKPIRSLQNSNSWDERAHTPPAREFITNQAATREIKVGQIQCCEHVNGHTYPPDSQPRGTGGTQAFTTKDKGWNGKITLKDGPERGCYFHNGGRHNSGDSNKPTFNMKMATELIFLCAIHYLFVCRAVSGRHSRQRQMSPCLCVCMPCFLK